MVDFGPQRELPAVLLIDDDLVSREVTATLLTMIGHAVQTAEDGPASLRMIETGAFRPGIILMDAQMPGVSGVELVRQLRAAALLAPIYIVSGSRPPEELVTAADGLLLKPFNVEALSRLLDHGRADRPAQAVGSNLDPGDPVLNTEVLAQLRQIMAKEAVRETYDAVIADLGRRIEALEAAIARRDGGEIRRIGHAIKGGCGMVGAVHAARIGASLENISSASEDDSFDDSRALLKDLRATTLALEHMLEDELEH
jgi:CheY-like chemotaxis protein